MTRLERSRAGRNRAARIAGGAGRRIPASDDTPHARWRAHIKDVIARACRAKGRTKETLAKDLGVHLNSLSSAAYRVAIGIDLVDRIAAVAGASQDEKARLEFAWLEARGERTKDPTLRRAAELALRLRATLVEMRDWIKRRGLWEDFSRSCGRATEPPYDWP